jgi:hypothetical protein
VKLTWSAPNRSLGFVDALGVMGLLGLLVARFIPIAKLIPGWGCALRQTTGWPCLGCGLTRAADRFAHGNLLGAMAANPLGTAAAALFALAALWTVLHLTFKLPTPDLVLAPRETLWVRLGLLALVLLNYAYVIVSTRFPGLL